MSSGTRVVMKGREKLCIGGQQSVLHVHDMWYPHFCMVTPVQLMRPGIGWDTSCALGDCLRSRPKGRSQPRKLWFSIYSHPLPLEMPSSGKVEEWRSVNLLPGAAALSLPD